MIRFFVLLGLLVAAFAPHGAEARVQHPTTFFFCPMGAVAGDGCGQAPQVGLTSTAGSYQLTNCWGNGGAVNQLTGTTTDYTQPGASPITAAVPYNSPACEYPIGDDIPASQRLDPATASIPGCAYGGVGNTGPGGNPYLHCTGILVPTEFDNLELGPIGGHGCTGIIMSGAVANSAPFITIAHTNFFNDGNCAVDLGGDWFLSLGTSVTQFIFIDDTLDGNGLVFGDSYGSCGPPTLCNVTQSFKGEGAVFKNTLVKNFATRPMNFGLNAGQSFIFSNSIAQGWNLRNPNAHGEFIDSIFSVGAVNQQALFSNFFETTGAEQSQEATWPTQPPGGTGTLQNATMDHNFIALPFAGGSSFSSTVNGTIPAGTSTFVANSVTSGKSIGSGQQFTCGALVGVLSNPHSGQPSAGPGGGFNSTTNPANFPQTWGFDINGGATNNTGTISDGTGGPGFQLNITTVGPITPAIGSAVSGTGISAGTNVTAIAPGGATGIYTVDTSQLTFAGSLITAASWNATAALSFTVTQVSTITPSITAVVSPVMTAGQAFTLNGNSYTVVSGPVSNVYVINTSAGLATGTGSTTTPRATFTLSGTPTTPPTAGSTFVVSGVVNSPSSPNLFNGTFTVVSTSANTILVVGPSSTPGTYASGGVIGPETITTTIPNIYDGGWQASTTISCPTVAATSWQGGAIGGMDLIFNGPTYAQVAITNNILDEQTFSIPRAWTQGGSNVTISAITAPVSGSSTMTISAVPAPPAMTIGQGMFLAAYGTQRMVITAQLTSTAIGGALGAAGTYTVSNTNTGAFSGTGHGDTGSCTNPAIFGGNIDPSGSLSPTQMNQWGSVLVPGC